MNVRIGLAVTEHIAAGVVENNRVNGEIHRHFHDADGAELVRGIPAEDLIERLAAEADSLAGGKDIEAIGIAFPGIVRCGTIEESPNLPQLKGFPVEAALRRALGNRGMDVRLAVSNDADAVASGLAAIRGGLDRLIRVWTLGVGIGFGRYPASDGVWEGGHTIVSLDPGEHFCACGGRGHLEGIMGHRAIRLRFLDREPEEVFAAAKEGPNSDSKCKEFRMLWHRALAAATATSIHLEGPGKFYFTGMNARFVDVALLNRFVQEMVKMSPLQSYIFEVVPPDDEFAITGAVVNAGVS